MGHNRKWISSVPIFTLLLYVAGIPAIAGQHEHEQQVIKVGKTGETVFGTETRIGDKTFKPGPYRFQHRVEGSEHFVRFVSKTGKDGSADLKCTLEPLGKKSSQTEIYATPEDGAVRVTKVVVAGENVAHVFSSSPR